MSAIVVAHPTPNRPAPVRLDSLTQAQAAVVQSLIRARAAAQAARAQVPA
jgi:hypothetical protein